MCAKKRYGSILELYDDFKMSVKFELPREGGTGWLDSYRSFFAVLEEEGWGFEERDVKGAWRIFHELREMPDDRPLVERAGGFASKTPDFYDYSVALEKQKVHGVCLCHESGFEFFFYGFAGAWAGGVAAYYTVKLLDHLLKRIREFEFSSSDLKAKVKIVGFKTKKFGRILIRIDEISHGDLQVLVSCIEQRRTLDQFPKELLEKLDFELRMWDVSE